MKSLHAQCPGDECIQTAAPCADVRNDPKRADSSRPNILAVLPDQWRRKAISAFGDPNVSTPHLDALIRQGVTCTNACSTYPVCVPFRSTLMTGVPAGLRGMPPIGWALPEGENRLATSLDAAGYETVYIGKWHLADHRDRHAPVTRAQRGPWSRWRGFEWNNNPFDTRLYFDDEPESRRFHGHQNDILFDQAEAELATLGREKPFFLCLSVEPPHDTTPDAAHLARDPLGIRDKFMYAAAEPYAARWRDRPLLLPPNWGKWNPATDAYFQDALRGYYALIEHIDDRLGHLRRRLEELGLAGNTMILFFSDHGDLCGSQLAAHKSHPFDESVGIPLVVVDPRHPGRAGTQTDLPVSTEDFLPTLLGYAGETPNESYGRDLSGFLRGIAPEPERDGVHLEYRAAPHHGDVPTWFGWRTRTHTAAWKQSDAGILVPWLLFNRQADPYEVENLIDQEPRILADLAERLRDRLGAWGYPRFSSSSPAP
jgi:arylsulfatase A-like enzyme